MEECSIRILLIEDNPGDARLVKEMLAEGDPGSFYLSHAERLSEGLTRLKEDDFQVVLLDLSLPDAQGLDTVSQVCAQAPHVPAVVLTGLDDETLAIRAVQEGAQDYLVKGQMDYHLLKKSIRYGIERKRAEEALQTEKRRFQTLSENAPFGMAMIDQDGTYRYVNPKFRELFGYDLTDLPDGKTWFRKAYPDPTYRHHVISVWEEDLRSSKPGMRRSRIFTVTCRDTTEKVINFIPVQLESGETLMTCEDITERKRTEEALRESEEEAKRLSQENAVIAEIGRIISSTLSIGEVYKLFSEKVAELIPFDRIGIGVISMEENTVSFPYIEGISVSGRQPGDTAPLAGTAAEKVTQTRKGHLFQMESEEEIAIEVPGLLPEFRSGIRSALTVPLVSRDQVIGMLSLRSTIPGAYTDRDLKLAESIGSQIAGAIANSRLFTERQRLEERLRRAEKMEAIGTLSGGVAHDLNNVLGVLVGYSELLLMEIPEGNLLRRHVSNILQSSQRAAAIIQDLLTLARRGVAVSEVVNLNPVISDYLKTPEFEKLQAYHPRVTFRTALDKDLMNIKGSPIHLSKTIMNLLSNAAEAITDHGEVTIQTENRYLDRPITGYDHIQEGDYVILRVLDNGKGISAKDLGKIFEPFYTKKVMGRSGTGLGLTVVWGTVKDHDGYIDVQSEEGKGSVFTLYFPVTREQRVSDKVASLESYKGRGESILVVDDVKEQRELATAMLNNLGYRVSAVSSGEEALAYIRANRVDLVVLDMIMNPGMDGLMTYQKVLGINPKQKAIIVSGFSETDRVKKAQELGAGAYVPKPYIREKIGLAIKTELDK